MEHCLGPVPIDHADQGCASVRGASSPPKRRCALAVQSKIRRSRPVTIKVDKDALAQPRIAERSATPTLLRRPRRYLSRPPGSNAHVPEMRFLGRTTIWRGVRGGLFADAHTKECRSPRGVSRPVSVAQRPGTGRRVSLRTCRLGECVRGSIASRASLVTRSMGGRYASDYGLRRLFRL